MRGDRDRRELEVLHRLAVSLPRSLTVTGVTDALAEGLVDAIERACECTITSWERDANTLSVLSVCEPGGIEPSWRGVVYDAYTFQKVTGWTPVLSPGRGDPLFEARPN